MENISYFFDGWLPILRIIVVGTLGYCALIIMIRMMRSRTLARLSAFDFVVTIAIGASFGRVLTARSIPLAEAVAAFMLLVLLQFLVSWLQMRSRRFSRWISTPPTLLFYRGSVVAQAMRRERITEDDLLSAVREHGAGSLSEVEAIVFEPNGRLGVVKKSSAGDGSAIPAIHPR